MKTVSSPGEISDEYIITKEFRTSTEFSQYIEREAIAKHLGCLEVLTKFLENRNIDAASVACLVTPALREKIRVEAEGLNLLKRTSGVLPL